MGRIWARTTDAGWRSQYVYHFCDRFQTLSGHISMTKMIHNKKNVAAIDRGAAPRSKSDEFLSETLLVNELTPVLYLKPLKQCCTFWDPESQETRVQFGGGQWPHSFGVGYNTAACLRAD